jgi:hypothetical protein
LDSPDAQFKFCENNIRATFPLIPNWCLQVEIDPPEKGRLRVARFLYSGLLWCNSSFAAPHCGYGKGRIMNDKFMMFYLGCLSSGNSGLTG